MNLYQIVRKVIGQEDVALDDGSNADNTAGWDSLKNMELIFAIESTYRVRFTVKEVARLKTIGDLRRLLVTKGADVDVIEPARKELLRA
jgi:acyl carrier protein